MGIDAVIAYASRTGTRRNLAALRDAGWRLLLSPTGVLRTEGVRYCLDNGAWTAHVQGTPWDADAFLGAAARFGAEADFVVAPDVVGGGQDSLRLSLSYLPQLLDQTKRVLVPAQDGLVVEDFAPFVSERVGVFIGGSTEYKLSMIPRFGPWCRARNVWCHVGRVNTKDRIRSCAIAGVTSFDGTSASRYAVTLPHLDEARRQGVLFMDE